MRAVEAGQHQPDRGAVARRHQLDRGFRQAGLAQALHQAGMDRAAGAETVGAAAQDHRVAGFQAQRAGIGGDVGPAFEDHADHAERHPHALDGHAVRALPALGDGAYRIGDVVDHLDAVGHRRDPRRRQRQPVDEGGGGAGGADLGDVLGIGGEDRRRIGPDRLFHRGQRAVLLLGRGNRQHPRSGAGLASQLQHQRRQVGAAVNGFQRGGHGGHFGIGVVRQNRQLRRRPSKRPATQAPPG